MKFNLCEQLEFIKELQLYEMWGISLYIDSQEATPDDILNAHEINEEADYMRDYIFNKSGSLIELCFNKIKL
jgi:hypothetical protein